MTVSTNQLGALTSTLNTAEVINPDAQQLIQQNSSFGEVNVQALAEQLAKNNAPGADQLRSDIMANLPAAKREELGQLLGSQQTLGNSGQPMLLAGNIGNGGNGTFSNANNAMAEMKSALGAPSVERAIPQIRGASTSSQIYQTLNSIAQKYGFSDPFTAVNAYREGLAGVQKFERQVSGLVGGLSTNPTPQQRANFNREFVQPAVKFNDQVAQSVNSIAGTNVIPEIQASAATRAEQNSLNRQRDTLAAMGVTGLPDRVEADGKNGPATQNLRDGLQGVSVRTAQIQIDTNKTLARYGRSERVVVDGRWGQDTADKAALAKQLQTPVKVRAAAPTPVQAPAVAPAVDNRNLLEKTRDGLVGLASDAKLAAEYTVKNPGSLVDSTVESVLALPKFAQAGLHGVSFGIVPMPKVSTPTEQLSANIGNVTGNVVFAVGTGGLGQAGTAGKVAQGALLATNAGGQNVSQQIQSGKPINAGSVAIDVATAPAGLLIPGGQTAAGTIVRQVTGGAVIDTTQQLGQQYARDGKVDINNLDVGQLALGAAGNFIPAPGKKPQTFTSSDGTKVSVVPENVQLPNNLRNVTPPEASVSKPSASTADVPGAIVRQNPTNVDVSQNVAKPVAPTAPTSPPTVVPTSDATRKLNAVTPPPSNSARGLGSSNSPLINPNGQSNARNPLVLNNVAATIYSAAGFKPNSIANTFASLPSFAAGRPYEVGLISGHGANLANGQAIPHPTETGVNVIIPQAVTFKVPEGRTVTVFAVEGGTIYDRLGNAVETFAAGQQSLKGGSQSGVTADANQAGQQSAYSKTYRAGEDAPVTMFTYPKGLDIGGQAVTLFPNHPDAAVGGVPILSVPPGRAVSIVEMMEKYPHIKDWVVCACQENPALPGKVNNSDVVQAGTSSNQVMPLSQGNPYYDLYVDTNAALGIPNAFRSDNGKYNVYDFANNIIQNDPLMGDFLNYTLNNPNPTLNYNVGQSDSASRSSNVGAISPSNNAGNANAGEQRLGNILGDSAQRGSSAPAGPEWKGNYQPSTQYTKASEIAVISPGTSQWKQAVAALQNGGVDNINNLRVPTASDAKRLLTEAFGDKISHQVTYATPQAGTYQLHPSEVNAAQGIYNDLSHIKIVEPSGRENHIWFGRADTTNASTSYVSQRKFDLIMKETGLSAAELNQLDIKVGGNLIDGSGSQFPQVIQPNPANPHTDINGFPR